MGDKKQSLILDKNGAPFNISSSEINNAAQMNDAFSDAVSISQYMAGSNNAFRTRSQIYRTLTYMAGDPIISTALNLHITQALGAHESTSEVFFLEAKPDISQNERNLVDELRDTIVPMLNQHAYELAYMATAMGDAFLRVYSKPKKGILDMLITEQLHPVLVQPMMRCSRTMGYVVSTEERQSNGSIILSNLQLARMKMPRTGIVPQLRILTNAQHSSISEDDFDNLPLLVDTIGGSFLHDAERPFELLQNALYGLNSSRIKDAVEESLIALNTEGMTSIQAKKYVNSVVQLLTKSSNRLKQAISNGVPIPEKIRHLIPISGEKQLLSIENGLSGSGNANSYNVDDVMVYARMLAAVLGHDLSMLGFADQLAGGLGEGGFYRVSAQAAQRSIFIRTAFSKLVDDIVDIHLYQKTGGSIFKNRPYQITYIGAQTALEKEKQDIQERRAISTSTLLQNIQVMKDLGFKSSQAEILFKRQMAMDEEDALIYAELMEQSNLDEQQDNE